MTRYIFDPKALLAMFSPDTDVITIADTLGTGREAVYKWLSNNTRFDAWQADRFACRIGLHPANIWGDQWWDECAAAEEAKERSMERKRQRMREYKIRKEAAGA